ncbi:hypothetical protein [Rhodopirellula sp. MGV]|uniref:hypothetical protein n=1 Tax=Rhodopirellula sp. MGV TaxID=2023130 RepID=UPI000B96C25E|nr:hypothetical protein [Rhodopirellula sp. MGV]OYP30013.1 hypothetical protein CGZ80_23560 [Rhodopirellula sp. MGV]PNY33487.1 hypothetical protein C2E31_28565 [Rhodopirellula baltica]
MATTEFQMSTSADAADFPYRALSRSAIASTLLFAVGLIGLMPPFEMVLVLTLVGVLFGIFSIRSINRYPDEFSGKALAKFALVANLVVLVTGVSMHTYTYLTEVPPGHVRVPFSQLKFDADPDRPTEVAYDLDGKDVFIKGYIHPSSGGGMLRQFVMVGDLGTCCFGGQPKSSEMIEVTLTGGETVKGGMTRRKLAGKFILNKVPQSKTDFNNSVFYRIKGTSVN